MRKTNGTVSKPAKSSLPGFLDKYGKSLIALVAVAVVTFVIMQLFSQAAFTAHAPNVIAVEDPVEISPQHWAFTEADFEGTCIRMLSTWYYPEQLLTPENIDDYEPVPVPEGAPVVDYLTQRFVVQVPQNGQAYKIWLRELQWSVRAWVNGEFAGERGNPADNSEDMRVSRRPLIVYGAPDENGIIEIVVQTASFRHHEDLARPMTANISLASTDYKISVRSAGRSFDTVLVGMYMGFALLTLGLFFTRPRNIENLWFALYCSIMAILSGLEGGQLTQALPFISEDFVYYTRYVGKSLLVFLMMLYLDRIFPKVIPKVMLWLLGGATAVVAGVVAFTQPAYFTLFANRYEAFIPLMYLAFLIPLALRFRNPLPEQIISLFGLAMLLAGIISDMLRNNNLITWWTVPYTATELFTAVFAVAQLMALFMGNSRKTMQAQEAERRIAAEKDAIERVNELKTEFLANVSHELKTPLTVMSGHAQHSQMALQDIPDAGDAERSMKLIAGEADRLALMVTQVLDVTQIDEGRMALDVREVVLPELIQTAMETYYPVFSKNHNALRLEPASTPPVLCDAARTTQVLVNLVSNAAQHTRDGTITVSARAEGNMVRVTVADTGDGIAPERMATLFERYGTKKAPGETGTGLGLYISKHIVEAQGGTLTIESEAGKGTTASFTLQTGCA